MEIFGAIALLFGIILWPELTLAGGTLLVLVLLGAIGTHLAMGDDIGKIAPPVALLLLAFIVIIAHVR